MTAAEGLSRPWGREAVGAEATASRQGATAALNSGSCSSWLVCPPPGVPVSCPPTAALGAAAVCSFGKAKRGAGPRRRLWPPKEDGGGTHPSPPHDFTVLR